MSLFAERRPPTRAELLEEAARYRSKGKRKKAIAAYQRVLESHPEDHETHGRLAPLLAEDGEGARAWTSFSIAAETYRQKGFLSKAISLYLQGLEHGPHHEEGWVRLSELYVEHEKLPDAVQALVRGRATYRRGYDRPRAIRLLRRLLELVPGDVGFTIDLAFVLKRDRRVSDGRQLLEALVALQQGKERRRVRRALFAYSPTPAALFRWLFGR